ncbi:YbaB/EbfC family nucleoid-associated protein [Streptosporangium sp. NPDC001559]|uniref:YbaB/EbfC family nucleoid-associated protein n=1 Tax=Streptosporangium sp. NPDC001559 TaxID=3366187 RepID=UPI0036E91A5A
MHQNGQRFDDMLAEGIRSLSLLEGLGDPAENTLQGSGQAADGQVSVLVGPDGRLAALNLNPRVMRMASEDLAREILTAVNAALDDLRASIPGLDPAAIPDPGRLAESLEGVHADVTRRLDEFASGIEFTVRRLEER